MSTMRKIFALAMVALLALTVALAAVGCGQKAEETGSTTTETTPPMESTPMDTTMMDTTNMLSDTSSMQH